MSHVYTSKSSIFQSIYLKRSYLDSMRNLLDINRELLPNWDYGHASFVQHFKFMSIDNKNKTFLNPLGFIDENLLCEQDPALHLFYVLIYIYFFVYGLSRFTETVNSANVE